MTALIFIVSEGARGSAAAIEGFKFRAFGFLSKNIRCDEWLVGSGWTSNRFKGSMLVENGR